MTITGTSILETAHGDFQVNYHRSSSDSCLTLSIGDVTAGVPPVRLHSACLFGEALDAINCDCQAQLRGALQQMGQEGQGVLVYLFQEGRGIGLEAKVQVTGTQQREGLDSIEAMVRHGFAADVRDYTVAAVALQDLGVGRKLRLVSNNPQKQQSLEAAGFEIVDKVAMAYGISNQAHANLVLKAEKMGHEVQFDRLWRENDGRAEGTAEGD